MFTIFDEELMKDSYYRNAVDSLSYEQRGILEESMKRYLQSVQGKCKSDAARYCMACLIHHVEQESFKEYLKGKRQEDRNE